MLDGVTAAVGDSGVNLSWSEPTDFDRAGVMIFRKTGAAVPTTADTLVGTFPEGVTSAVDTAVEAGATYTYAAFPYDHDAPPNLGPSVVSAPVRIPTPPDPAPPAVTVQAPAPVATSGATPVTAAKAAGGGRAPAAADRRHAGPGQGPAAALAQEREGRLLQRPALPGQAQADLDLPEQPPACWWRRST